MASTVAEYESLQSLFLAGVSDSLLDLIPEILNFLHGHIADVIDVLILDTEASCDLGGMLGVRFCCR